MSTIRRLEQAGIVSLMVTFLMMIVVSLIVLGFSETTRRNSREALDRQLSSQAYYAAESGINQAITALKGGYTLAADGSDAQNCQGPNSFIVHNHLNATGGPVLLSTDNVANNIYYTCLLVNDKVKTINEDAINQGASKVENIHMSQAGKLTFTWSPSDDTSNASSCPNVATDLPTSLSALGCKFALLRLDLLPSSVGSTDASTLAANTHTFYFEPTKLTTNGAADYTATNGKVTGANCGTTGHLCSVTLDNLGGEQNFYARVSTVYNDLHSLAIGSDVGAVVFTGSQLQIDATGKAQDELRRIRVRVPLNGTGTVPSNAISSTDGICKRFTNFGGTTSASPNFNPLNSSDPAALCLSD